VVRSTGQIAKIGIESRVSARHVTWYGLIREKCCITYDNSKCLHCTDFRNATSKSRVRDLHFEPLVAPSSIVEGKGCIRTPEEVISQCPSTLATASKEVTGYASNLFEPVVEDIGGAPSRVHRKQVIDLKVRRKSGV
jgi:hypothetical protein